MATKTVLDLKGVISPLDLLKCKSLLNTMKYGEVLEVILADKEVADHLSTIVRKSKDELYSLKKKQNDFCICIRKGTGQKK